MCLELFVEYTFTCLRDFPVVINIYLFVGYAHTDMQGRTIDSIVSNDQFINKPK